MNHTDPTAPIRKSSLPCTPPPEWEFYTWFPHPDRGGDMVPGERQRGVLVRRRVTYSDWEPVRPDRWADERESDVAAAPVVVSPPPDHAALRDRVRQALCEQDGKGYLWDTDMLEPDEYGEVADAVLAVLPESGRAATLLDAAALLDQRASRIDAFASSDYGPEAQVVRELADAANELRRLAAEAPQPDTEAQLRSRYSSRAGDATVASDMCPRCKGDNSEAFQLCATCAAVSQPAADDGKETR